jgi:hypothetical protein
MKVGILVWAVAALLCSSLWFFRYFPSTDGSSHIYTLKIYEAPTHPGFHGYFQRRSESGGNVTSLYLGRLLLRFVPLPAVERAILTIIFIVWTAGLWTYARAAAPREAGWIVLLLLPVGMNFFLRMGFHNFALSGGLFLFLFAALWRFHSRPEWKWVGLSLLIMLGLFATHLFAFALGLVALSMAALFRGPRDPRSWVLSGPPILLFGLRFFTGESSNQPPAWETPFRLLLRFARLDFIIGWTVADYLLSALLWFVLLVSIRQGWALLRKTPDWRKRLPYPVVLPLVYILLFLVFPERMKGGSYLSARIQFAAFLSALPVLSLGVSWVKEKSPTLEKSLLVGVLGIQTLWFLSGMGIAQRFDREVRTLLTYGERLEGRNVLYFCTNMDGSFHRVSPYRHFDSWFPIEWDVCAVSNYEALAPYFPLSYAKPIPKLEWKIEENRIRLLNLDHLGDVTAVMAYTDEEISFDPPDWRIIRDSTYPRFKLVLKSETE